MSDDTDRARRETRLEVAFEAGTKLFQAVGGKSGRFSPGAAGSENVANVTPLAGKVRRSICSGPSWRCNSLPPRRYRARRLDCSPACIGFLSEHRVRVRLTKAVVTPPHQWAKSVVARIVRSRHRRVRRPGTRLNNMTPKASGRALPSVEGSHGFGPFS